jgi:Uma2 family endonuclease
MSTLTETPQAAPEAVATPRARPETGWTAADLLDAFGPIPLWRVRLGQLAGEATEQDVLDIYAREKRLCELVDGILVEKTVGTQESYLAVFIAHFIFAFLKDHDLGIVLGADGMARLVPGLLRISDVSFIRWGQFPGHAVPDVLFLTFAPDLAVQVLSPSNTAKEMGRKLSDYFATGVRLVWYIDPDARTVEVFTALGQSTVLREGATLDGGKVLPGFALPLAQLFAELGPKPGA